MKNTAKSTAGNTAKNTARKIVTAANRPVARRRLHRTLASTEGPYKIEVGAHAVQRPGWICSDVGWRARHYLDITARWPLPDRSTSHIYADNVIEHLGLAPNRAFFREAHRVLRPGGAIRLATPDVGRLAEIYLRGDEHTGRHVVDLRERGYEAAHPVDLLRTAFQDCGHHVGYLWDLDALTDELEAAGFTHVRRFEVGESEDAAFQGLEARPDRTEAPVQLVAEARRAE